MKKNTIRFQCTVNFCLLVFFIVLSLTSSAQSELKLYNNEKLKKENGLWGIIRDKTWIIQPQYDKIEGFASFIYGFILCQKGTVTDVYEKSYNPKPVVAGLSQSQLETFKLYAAYPKVPIIKDNQWTNAVDDLTPAQKQQFDATRTENIPYVKNGKWGFANEFYNVEPKYDSLFIICMEGSGTRTCDDVVGVSLNGKKGVVANDGTEIVLNKDYVNFQYRFTGGSDGRFEIVCRHKSGIDVVYDKYDARKNEFIETKDAAGLKGYVYHDDFVEPKYSLIKQINLPVADFECTLPGGAVEYRKGTELVSATLVNEYNAKAAKEEQLRKEKEEQQQKAEEIKRKEEEAQKQKLNEEVAKYIATGKDWKAQEVINVFNQYSTDHRNKMKALLAFLESSMVMNDDGEFLMRSSWQVYSIEMRNNYCKEVHESIRVYKQQLTGLPLESGQNGLYDKLVSYLKSAENFVSSCDAWADEIYTITVDSETLLQMLEYLETNAHKMKEEDDDVLGFISIYKSRNGL